VRSPFFELLEWNNELAEAGIARAGPALLVRLILAVRMGGSVTASRNLESGRAVRL